jgi:hypothetical protein
MGETRFRNRRAVAVENDLLRVTVTVEGGHLAEILDKASGVNPLWEPPWPSIEPSTYNRAKHPEYGDDSESKLLAGILGHNLCADQFGPPSDEEAAAGMTVHGEASVVPYEVSSSGATLTASAILPEARLKFAREIKLDGRKLYITETFENLSAWDHAAGWTQHVTLGPPFVERGKTRMRAPIARSYSLDTGGEIPAETVTTYTKDLPAAGFATHLMDPSREDAFFLTHSPASNLVLGYIWKRSDFPWLGVWVENHSRQTPPWNGNTTTWGMEFGASPLPEGRHKMIDRGGLFGEQGFRWIPARSRVTVKYLAFLVPGASLPESPDELKIGIPA